MAPERAVKALPGGERRAAFGWFVLVMEQVASHASEDRANGVRANRADALSCTLNFRGARP